MNNHFKMIHVRSENNKGVVSFRTKVDFDNSVIVWDMVVCSKKDMFTKSIAIELCQTSPLKSGVVPFSKTIVSTLGKHSDMYGVSLRPYLYFKGLVISDALHSNVLVSSQGDPRHLPKWVNALLASYYASYIVS